MLAMVKDLTRTQYKLAEAQFFLKHLEKHWRHVPQVDFYLSACISAARSVTWIMKAEFGKEPGWQEWYEERKPSNEIRSLLKSINDVRVRLTKTVPVRTRTSANIHVQPEDVTPELMSFVQSRHTESIQLVPIDESNTDFYLTVSGRVLTRAYLKDAKHELPEFQEQDARDVCKKYIKELEELVTECIERFGR